MTYMHASGIYEAMSSFSCYWKVCSDYFIIVTTEDTFIANHVNLLIRLHYKYIPIDAIFSVWIRFTFAYCKFKFAFKFTWFKL